MEDASFPKNELVKKLKRIKIFQYLHKQELEEIISFCKVMHSSIKEKIISEGEISPYVYAVLKGSVNIMVLTPSGTEVFLSPTGEGDVFGEAAIFSNRERTASVTSNDATLLQIHQKDLLRYINNNPASGIKILYVIIYSLLDKLREANQEIAFERKTSFKQEEVDDLIETYFNNKWNIT